MTTTPATQADITLKLLAMYDHRGDGLPTQYVNPDGPEAVEAILALRNVLRLFDERDAMPADRGGKDGPKGKAFAAFAAAKRAAHQGAGE